MSFVIASLTIFVFEVNINCDDAAPRARMCETGDEGSNTRARGREISREFLSERCFELQ